jgi:hypothetical protein
VFENKVPERIFGSKRGEVTGGWTEFVLFAKYNWNDQVKEDMIGGACSTNGGEEERLHVIGRKARGKDR